MDRNGYYFNCTSKYLIILIDLCVEESKFNYQVTYSLIQFTFLNESTALAGPQTSHAQWLAAFSSAA